MAKAMSRRKKVPTVSPRTSLTTEGSPPAGSASFAKSGAAIKPKRSNSDPAAAQAPNAWRMARGARRRGAAVSSASVPAVSKPYMT